MGKYDDIIDLPHHVSEKRVQMPLLSRAAQFAPFAALSGYEAVIAEAGRRTQTPVELTGAAVEELNEALCGVLRRLGERPRVRLTWFAPDARKEGGSYQTVTGIIRRYDPAKKALQLEDRSWVFLEKLVALEEEDL